MGYLLATIAVLLVIVIFGHILVGLLMAVANLCDLLANASTGELVVLGLILAVSIGLPLALIFGSDSRSQHWY